MPQPVPDRLAFDDVVIDFAGRRLSRAGAEQALEPKAFAVLALLAGAPGQVFTRDEILDAVWGHRHVTQSVLNRIMSLLRQALGEDAQHRRLLHTVYGIGCRFDLPVSGSGRADAPVERADDGTHLWSKTYARELRDVFAVQEAIARDVAQALSVRLDVAPFNRGQGGTDNVEAYERFLRWRSTMMLELYDFEHRRERLQLAREMVALDPDCVLCMDALAGSLDAMVREVDDVQAGRLRAEASGVRGRIAQVAPDGWIARRDRSNSLWREGKRAEAIALAKEIADTGPPTKERVRDYAYMIYAMGHLNDTIALVEQVRAVEPAAIFLSRDLQFDYTAARRYEDAEVEYQRGLELQGSQYEPTFVAFFRQLAGKRPGGIGELRGLHRRLLDHENHDTPFFRGLGEVLDDRAAMLGRAREALADPASDSRDPELAMRACASGLQETAGRSRGGRLLAADRPLGRRLRAGRRGRLPVPLTGADRSGTPRLLRRSPARAGLFAVDLMRPGLSASSN